MPSAKRLPAAATSTTSRDTANRTASRTSALSWYDTSDRLITPAGVAAAIRAAVERGARVIYLNKTAFRGLWRVNRRGGFNAPYGAYDRPYYRRETLLAASAALAGVEIRRCDFEEPLREAAAGDWVFLDPPYLPEGGFADFKRYTAGQFRDADHERLAAAMRDATGRGVLITMTNSDTDATRRIYGDFTATTMATRRDINLRSDARASSDLILTNY